MGSVFPRASRRDFIRDGLIEHRSVLTDRSTSHSSSYSFERDGIASGEQCDFVVERFLPFFHKVEIPLPLVKQVGF